MGNCMTSVLKKLRRKRNSEKATVLIAVGLDNAGKTSVLNRISNESGQDVLPTMGFRILSLKHKSRSVKIYDIGGARQIRSLWPKYYSDVHGLIYVVDASDVSRLTENKIVFGELIAHEHVAGKPILLLANKQDIRGAVDELDLVENLDVERVANAMRCPTRVETCSCLFSAQRSKENTTGIINGYKWLLDTVYKNFSVLDRRAKQTQNGSTTRAPRKQSKQSCSSMTPSRSSIRSNPFKPIREILQLQHNNGRVAGSSNENLLEKKRDERSSWKKLLVSRKNKTAPLGLGERMSKSRQSLDADAARAGLDILPINARRDNHHSMNLVTLDPANLSLSLEEMRERGAQKRPFTAPDVSRGNDDFFDPFVLFGIPGQVPQPH